jgi:hypothetical protein
MADGQPASDARSNSCWSGDLTERFTERCGVLTPASHRHRLGAFRLAETIHIGRYLDSLDKHEFFKLLIFK